MTSIEKGTPPAFLDSDPEFDELIVLGRGGEVRDPIQLSPQQARKLNSDLDVMERRRMALGPDFLTTIIRGDGV